MASENTLVEFTPPPPPEPTDLELIDRLEQEIVEQERSVEALEALEQGNQGVSTQSEQQLNEKREALASKRRHLEMLKDGVALDALARPKVETEAKYVQAAEWVLKEALRAKDVLEALHDLRQRTPDSQRAINVYERERDEMLKLRDRYEDLSKNIPADSAVRSATAEREREIQAVFNDVLIADADRYPATARYSEPLDNDLVAPEESAAAPAEFEPMLTAEEYDAEVLKLMPVVEGIEGYFRMLTKRNQLDAATLEELNGQLDEVQEQLQMLDEKAEDPAASRERRALMYMMNQLRAQYPATMRPVNPASLSSVRAKHDVASAKYASLQHRLSEDGRRAMRIRLATLSAMVRQAEDEAWRRHHPPLPPPPPEPSAPSDDAFKLSIRLAIARASTAAPVIASAAHTLSTQRRGMFSALGNAFRLK